MPGVALVLGAGGVVGGAWHAGLLAALAEAGWDARSADLIVGTSAGSGVGAMLRAGVSAGDLYARARGEPLSAPGARLFGDIGPVPPAPQGPTWRIPLASAPTALAWAALRPGRHRPAALMAAAMPAGTVSTQPIEDLYRRLHGDAWPTAPLWLVAVRQFDNRRVVFGAGDDPRPTVGQAVAASCAIPGVFAPVDVNGTTYIDGGVHSVHNLDLLERHPYDLVLVSAPMASTSLLPLPLPGAAMRQLIGLQLRSEVRAARRTGSKVVVLSPDTSAQRAMGNRPMDPAMRPTVARHVKDAFSGRLGRDRDLRASLATLGL